MAFLIAVDGGGTSCRTVIAASDGRVLGEGHAGPANIVTDPDRARDNILGSARLAAAEAGLPEDSLAESAAVLGLAGANIGDHASRFAARLPVRTAHIETDARSALQGALGEMDGAVAVLGTGSVFMVRRDGAIRSAGGWGAVVGDACSGSRLGRSLLEETLRAYDGLRPGSELTEAVLSRYGGDPGKVVEFARDARPRDFAGFAPLLFDHAERGDTVADAIVAAATRELEETLDVLIGAGARPFCLLGGLAQAYSRRLSAPLKQRERQPDGNALSGALAMAVAMFGKSSGGISVHG